MVKQKYTLLKEKGDFVALFFFANSWFVTAENCFKEAGILLLGKTMPGRGVGTGATVAMLKQHCHYIYKALTPKNSKKCKIVRS